jgi:hypothetical protein
MIPTRGWRDREARARHRNRAPEVTPASLELQRFMHEREAALAAATAGVAPTPVGIVTAAVMLQTETPPPVSDVTPDEPEVEPEADTEEPESEEPASEEIAAELAAVEEPAAAPAPKPKRTAKKA